MKNKLTFLLLLTATLFISHSQAQTFTAKAGLNLGNVKEKGGGGINPDYNMNPGFHVGMAVAFPINTWLAVEPALVFDQKGAKYKQTLLGTDIDASIRLNYIDIPVNLKVSQKMENDMRIFATAGPYLGIGLSGKIKADVGGQKVDEKVVWGSNDDDMYKRTEVGVTFGTGVEFNMIQLGLSYDLGLSNTSAVTEEDYSSKNRVLRFSVGYRFGN
ncbi:porin family protein [Dyadobacter sp. CY356]|uniref:porin family protein n=1 Tax=Dyadobacter sp. CY356 TaxID=2906442 RepID=UPI001F424777|nr:porin family protein [Dyadobacter sp. CY356]MCF0055115.1 PorT family protein [Dyadobacter sp. CY356]